MMDRNNCEEGKIIFKNNEVEYSFSQVKKWVIGMDVKVCKSKEQEHAHWYKLNTRKDAHFLC